MRLSQPNAKVEVPDGSQPEAALLRTTHMGIAAHADDLEVMAIDAILQCFGRNDRWFCGVVVCDGAGSPRGGPYAGLSDEQMRQVRSHEQCRAAAVGEYGAQVLLDHSSDTARRSGCSAVAADIATLISAARPEVVYTHSPTDRHQTHVAVALSVIEGIRSLPQRHQPVRIYGCEVWGDLDWLAPEDRITFDLSRHEELQSALLAVFDSQIRGGKRYDLAAIGRRHAHATFHDPHTPDGPSRVSLAVDLTPLITDPTQAVAEYVQRLLERSAAHTLARIRSLLSQRS